MRTSTILGSAAVAAVFGALAVSCSKAPNIQHAQCTANQVETLDTQATQTGSGCGDAGTIVMKCVDLSSATATSATNAATNAATSLTTGASGK